jgi:hypothetical protein
LGRVALPGGSRCRAVKQETVMTPRAKAPSCSAPIVLRIWNLDSISQLFVLSCVSAKTVVSLWRIAWVNELCRDGEDFFEDRIRRSNTSRSEVLVLDNEYILLSAKLLKIRVMWHGRLILEPLTATRQPKAVYQPLPIVVCRSTIPGDQCISSIGLQLSLERVVST